MTVKVGFTIAFHSATSCFLTPIVAWLEQNTAPTQLIASQTADDSANGGFSNPTARATSSNTTIIRTIPISPYAMEARYGGQGSVDDAANFVATMPAQTLDDRTDWIGNDLLEPQ
ncbi:tannase/feruloyl esterase family alpha/beta hydrolase [Phormidium tenue FACHB-886]|nr:tannase/feruloyl esterase family alpha/beta hydrolase [Phormidium tenue FACHB-886]